MMLLALSWTEPLFLVLRGAAAMGAFFLGWFATAPLFRFAFRLASHKPAPRILVFVVRFCGAGLLACLVFYFLPLGFGGGAGWGLGPGPGPGGGKASGHSGTSGIENGKPGKKETSPERQVVNIELLGGKRYNGDDKFYLLHGREPAVTIKEVEQYFEKNEGKLEVHIILKLDSVGQSHPAFQSLRRLADKYKMVTRVDTSAR